jgi:hypothetical protein
VSEWLDLMLDEIARKKKEQDEAAKEQEQREDADNKEKSDT